MDHSAPQIPSPAALQVAPTAPRSDRAWWIDGDRLFATKGATLPDLSIRSGQPAGHRVRYKFGWAPPWASKLRLFFPVFGLLLYMSARATAELDFALTEDEQQRHQLGRMFMLAACTLLIVGLGVLALSFAGATALGLLGISAFVVLLILGIYRTQYATVVRIDDQHIQLKLTPDAAAAFAAWSAR